MARVAYPQPETLSAKARDQLAQLGTLNITRMMSHHEGIMAAVARLGSELLVRGSLEPTLRELVILRIGQLCKSAYERHQHLSVARAVGVSESKLQALDSGDLGVFTAREELAIRVADEIHGLGGATEPTLRRCGAHFTQGQLVELCILAGYYVMLASFLASFDIEIEATPPLGESLDKLAGFEA